MSQTTAPKGTHIRQSRTPRRLRIRRASDQDRSFAWHAYEDTVKEAAEALQDWDPSTEEARFNSSFDPDRTYVATMGPWDAGWIQFCDDGKDVRVRQIHVVPRCQRNGVGSALMKLTAADAKKRGRDLVLVVMPDNIQAQAFYGKYGFIQDGTEGEKLRLRLPARR